MRKLLNYYIVSLLAVFGFLLSLNVVFATESLIGSGCTSCAEIMATVKTKTADPTDPCYKYCTGNYELNDFVQILINGVNILFGLVGTLTLAMFIYGGLMFLISSGNTERVTKAKQILINASIGLVIIFTSYLIIQFVLTSLGYTKSDWFTAPK